MEIVKSTTYYAIPMRYRYYNVWFSRNAVYTF